MLSNEVFDLITAIQNKSEAIAVYDTYLKDSKGCSECANIWRQMKQRDEEDLSRLSAELEKHARLGELTKGLLETGPTTTTMR